MQTGRQRLAEWLVRSKFNQQAGAALLGMTSVFLSQILHGHRRPGLMTAVRIENLTGIPCETWLLTEISTDPEPVGAGAHKANKTKR